MKNILKLSCFVRNDINRIRRSDMKERIEFGGDIYLGAGSHGCVNTPFDAAQFMYSVVNIGTPVVIHD